ncbi:glycosyltransferase family 2 protein [Roseibium algae]|uniref:Glycosyltransferase family 2 protein n=1 Tax=Roseibium algae TaxID=3123038 RepID=A0ABU8TQU2_9HYPH
MSLPKVSAIIPCYNTRDCVVTAVESALNQAGHPIEVIVVDDGSSDDSADVVERAFSNDSRVCVIRLPNNQGPSAARNAGFEAAQGEWIGLLDSDDIWRPNRVSTLLQHEADADFIADNLMGFDAIANVETGAVYEELSNRWLNLTDFITPSAPDRHDFGYLQPLIRRSFLIEHAIRYRVDVRAGEDLLLNLSILAKGGRAYYVNEPLYVYATPVGAVSRNASPHSRSTADTKPLIQALIEFSEEFKSKLTSSENSAFKLRLADLRSQAPIGAFHRARTNKRYLEMLFLIAREPIVRRKIFDRILNKPGNGISASTSSTNS